MKSRIVTGAASPLLALTLVLGGCMTSEPIDIASAGPGQGSRYIPVAVDITDPPEATADPAKWPRYDFPIARDPATEAMIADMIERMTPEEKVGQVVQADLCCVTADDVREYNLGSVLAGGNSGPNGDDFAPAEKWLEAADAFYDASVDRSDGGLGIPVVWGIDAVHGHANIIGATIFPHNIGLGAARDSELIERIAEVTATEIRVTGQEWTFAPTVAVPQDFRWGRAYEGYSSDPALVSSYVGAMVRGLQGAPDNNDILGTGKVIASTKHYLADGGTLDGVDQGDARISEEELRDIHGAPYGPAIENGVATVMASFSSWNGSKLTGNRSLLTDVLKTQMGFDGLVVSDWNAHGQIDGCSNSVCPRALEAGIDLYMAPDTWKGLYEDLLARAKNGTLQMDRLDEAVAANLRVKARLGLFDAGRPSERALSGRYDLLGAPEHRAIAREAVRKSLVLLKNEGVLPLKGSGRVLVAGDGANDVGRQSGGWTITWQGTGLDRSHFPGATSIWDGLKSAITQAGGTAERSPEGTYSAKPDAAIVVFGEQPYAEFQGDRATLQLDPALTAPIETMRKLKEEGVPVVAVMITGRPLYVNPVLNLADAFVVAWLPGSEGGGLADVIVGGADGTARHDFVGKLPAAWPSADLLSKGVLYPFGYGLDYRSPAGSWTPLDETIAFGGTGDSRVWFTAGVPAARWSLLVSDLAQSSELRITTVPSEAADGCVRITAEDHLVQEGARRFVTCDQGGIIELRNFEPLDIDRETNGDVMLVMTMKVTRLDGGMSVIARGDDSRAQIALDAPATGEFSRIGVPLKCLRTAGADMTSLSYPAGLRIDGAADISIADIRLSTDADTVLPCL